jgi:hypothetical protein
MFQYSMPFHYLIFTVKDCSDALGLLECVSNLNKESVVVVLDASSACMSNKGRFLKLTSNKLEFMLQVEKLLVYIKI